MILRLILAFAIAGSAFGQEVANPELVKYVAMRCNLKGLHLKMAVTLEVEDGAPVENAVPSIVELWQCGDQRRLDLRSADEGAGRMVRCFDGQVEVNWQSDGQLLLDDPKDVNPEGMYWFDPRLAGLLHIDLQFVPPDGFTAEVLPGIVAMSKDSAPGVCSIDGVIDYHWVNGELTKITSGKRNKTIVTIDSYHSEPGSISGAKYPKTFTSSVLSGETVQFRNRYDIQDVHEFSECPDVFKLVDLQIPKGTLVSDGITRRWARWNGVAVDYNVSIEEIRAKPVPKAPGNSSKMSGFSSFLLANGVMFSLLFLYFVFRKNSQVKDSFNV